MQYGEALGLPDKADQLRVGILIMGLWWGLFSLPTLKVLRDRGGPPAMRQPIGPAARKALQAVGSTLRNVRQYRMLAWFLLGFLLYNEGIQTVISQASTFATKTPELSFTTSELAMLILMIQFIALPGAILVGWLSNRIGERPALQLCLAVFVGLLVAAFFVNSKSQFWCLGVVLALVMGGSQSVSRAIMGLMTPPARTAEFFGFFNFSGKATSFLGPFVFGSIFKVTGNTRLAVLSLLVFFLVGWAIVARVRIDEGRRQALLR
jgi:UMF1 family MFS transporter